MEELGEAAVAVARPAANRLRLSSICLLISSSFEEDEAMVVWLSAGRAIGERAVVLAWP